MYLAPPLAFLSNHSCNLNALLKSFIDDAVAPDKSASKFLELSQSKSVKDGILALNVPEPAVSKAAAPSNVILFIVAPLALFLTLVGCDGSLT